MRPVSSPVPPRSAENGDARAARAAAADEWSERAGRLYADLERPARAMVRRAFRGAFSDDELDDVYASAWVGTLRALGRRHAELSDEDVRRYLLTAVANQASKELRRRRRKPTTQLDSLPPVADGSGPPDERAVDAERSRMVRDLLSSLPARRRAVMLLRYGWGLEPRQVCELIEGLSPRAYRKEITRGVDELVERMRQLENGEWCADRESLLKAYAAGIADADQRRQARAHVAHCHECSELVARLSGHLHDLGPGLAVAGAFDGLDREVSLGDRLGEAGDRVREAVGGLASRGGEGIQEAAGQVVAAGGARGAGTAAGAGLLAKLTGLGTAGKIAMACLGGGAAATVCVSAGVVPGAGLPGVGGDRERAAPREPGQSRSAIPVDREMPTEPVAETTEPAPDQGAPPAEPAAPEPQEPAPAPEPVETVSPSAPPVTQEFGEGAAASPSGGSDGGTTSSGGGGGGGGGSYVQREFGGP
jgi:RNA polymerase sigma factor (sigma-70 family)